MTELLFRAVVPPGEKVGGESQQKLSADWWKLAFELPDGENNPLTDFTGENAVQQRTLAQDGKLLYLFGTFEGETNFVTTRDVTLPQEVEYLFGPLINISYGPDELFRNYDLDVDSPDEISNEAIQLLLKDSADTALKVRR